MTFMIKEQKTFGISIPDNLREPLENLHRTENLALIIMLGFGRSDELTS